MRQLIRCEIDSAVIQFYRESGQLQVLRQRRAFYFFKTVSKRDYSLGTKKASEIASIATAIRETLKNRTFFLPIRQKIDRHDKAHCHISVCQKYDGGIVNT